MRLAPSAWGIPFKVSAACSRDRAVDAFAEHLAGEQTMLRQLPTLTGRRLRCHCGVNQRCHGDMLVRAWDVWRSGCKATHNFEVPTAAAGRELAKDDEGTATQDKKKEEEEQELPDKSLEAKRIEPQAPQSSRMVALEVFCGYAGLSKKLQRAGFEVVPIDWGGNRHKPAIAIVRVDLTSPAGRELLQNQLNSGKVAFAWFAPPCGTFSRAREKPIPAHLQKAGRARTAAVEE